MSHLINTVEQLEALYGVPHERAVRKEIDFLNEDYRAFIQAAPFLVMASAGAAGTDCSPKGDAAGFVAILDERTLAIPDRPGNNRVDNLRNIIEDGRVSLLFIIPGIGETLRVNGHASISVEPALLQSFAVRDKLPRSAIVVHVEAAYFHCSKAAVRSSLWDASQHLSRDRLPSAGAMHKRLAGGDFDAETYDRELPARTQAGLY
jgi:PPOX class probable FMN-dependent enzyme